MSFVCAKLSDSVGWTEAPYPMLAIHFFCGENINRMADTNASLQGMLNSLLAQLLAQHPNVNITPELLASVQNDNIDSLCDLFDQCVRQLPRGGILFCVVDGISWYEDTKRRTDVQKAFERIASLTEPKSTGCIVKFLVTSPTKMRYMPGNGAGKGVLLVPGRLPPQGGFTNMKWSSKGGKDVEGLRV